MVKVEIIIPRVVSASWDAEFIDLHLNDSSWCAENIKEDLIRYMAAKTADAPCLCDNFTGKYLREATEDDLAGIDTVKFSDGNYKSAEEKLPCTCAPSCPSTCQGECGCAACHAAFQDFGYDE